MVKWGYLCILGVYKSDMKKRSTTIFGIHPIKETILAGEHSISKLWLKNTSGRSIQQLITLAKKHSIPYSKVPQAKLDRLTKGNHQGAIAFLAPITFAELTPIVQGTYEQGRNPLIVLLDSLQDVYNIGAIVRTAVGMGVDALVITAKGTAPISNDVMKASVGALTYLPVCRVYNLADAITYLQHSGLQVVACSEKGCSKIYKTDLCPPTALLFGGESRGISPSYKAMADVHLQIPMMGKIASLNVSVAAAITLYEVVRQRIGRAQH